MSRSLSISQKSIFIFSIGAMSGAAILVPPLWISILLVGIAVIAICLVRPLWGLALLFTLAPLHGILLLYLPIGHPGYYWKEMLTFILFLGFALQLFRGDVKWWAHPTDRWIVLYFLTLLIVSLFNSSLLAMAFGLKIGFAYVVLYVIARHQKYSNRFLIGIGLILLFEVTLLSLYGLWQQLVGAGYLASIGHQYNSQIRFTGGFLRSFATFDQPFPFANYLAVSLLIMASLWSAIRAKYRLFLIMATIAIVPALLLTFARSAWIGLIGGISYLLIRRNPALLWTLPLILIAGFLIMPFSFKQPATNKSSGEERLGLWVEHWESLKESPFGLGVGSVGSSGERIAKITGKPNPLWVDNQYLKVLLEGGVLGLISFIAFLVSIGRAAQGINRYSNHANLEMGFVAAFIALALSALVSNVLEMFPIDLTFWILLGVFYALQHKTTPETAKQIQPQIARPFRV